MHNSKQCQRRQKRPYHEQTEMDLLTFDKRVHANVLFGSFSCFNVFEGYIIIQTNS